MSPEASEQDTVEPDPEVPPVDEDAGADRKDQVARAKAPGPINTMWLRYRTGIVSGVVVLVVSGWAGGVGGWLTGAADSVRDVVRGMANYDAGEADTVKEEIQRRDVWAVKPKILNGSIRFLSRYADEELITVDRFSGPTVISPHEAATKGLVYDGAPVYMLGRVESEITLGDNSLGSAVTELELEGGGPSTTWAALGQYGSLDSSHQRGETVLLRGVVTAIGRKQTAAGLTAPAAYFTAIEQVDPGVGWVPDSIKKDFP